MTTYKDIRGTHIKTVTTDPPAPVNGQMWYNSTTQVMKGFTSNDAGSWASGTAINTARFYIGGSGTVTAGLAWGGQTAPGSKVGNSEIWNGTSWTEVNDLNTGRRSFGGTGTSTAAITAGGATTENVAVTETWNGSSWTEVNDLNTAKTNFWTSRGSTTVMLVFGQPTTESYNGSSWTELNDLNLARGNGAGVGTVTSSLCFSGYTAQTSPNYPTEVEEWDGTSWTERTNFSSARSAGGSFGTAEACFLMGGSPPSGGALSTVEEWTAPATSTVTFTAS